MPGKPTESAEQRRARLLGEARELPASPGVYTFRGARGEAIYIGKAKKLRARVTSYFRPGADDGRMWFPLIVRKTHSLAFLITDTDKDAVLLENSLIKQQKPRFNILLTDDKSFLSLKLVLDEDWPRLRLVRRPRKDGALYFGPYTTAREARGLERLVKKHFLLRTCSDAEFRQRSRPCLEYQMGRCAAPCVGLQDRGEYQQVVEDVVAFLKGRDATLKRRLEERMASHVARLEFEQAARLRDELATLKSLLDKRPVARSGAFQDQDVFGVAKLGHRACLRVLHVRGGQVIGATEQDLETSLPEALILDAALGQLYSEGRPAPRELLLPLEIEDSAAHAQLLSERRGDKVTLRVPKRGAGAALLELAMKNAQAVLDTDSARRKALLEVLDELARELELEAAPQVIECYDISTIQGAYTVASMVRFEGGEPRRDRFRCYKIRSVEGQDDFASMREVLSRRFSPGKQARDGRFPDLVVIDGGKGQLSAALAALESCGIQLPAMTVVGLAKARRQKGSLERVFQAQRDEPLVLDQSSAPLKLLARIRDAAHDHAIGYHRELRRKRMLRSGLDEIPGVGPVRRRRVLKHFGNLRAVKAASLAELEAVDALPKAIAALIWEFYQERGGGL